MKHDANHWQITAYRHHARLRNAGNATLLLVAMLCLVTPLTTADESTIDDAAAPLIHHAEPLNPEVNAETFDAVVSAVGQRIFDVALIGDDWKQSIDHNRADALNAGNFDDLASAINAQLDTLNVSHTHFFTPADTRYYQILGIFNAILDDHPIGDLRTDGALRYSGIGVEYAHVDGAWFLRDVLNGGPADYAGLLRGDEITHANGQPFHPVRSFMNNASTIMTLTVRRTSADEEPITLRITPESLDPTALYESAITDSVRIIESNGMRFGYVRVRSYAGKHMHDAVEEALASEPLKSCDHLLLDVRGGWGGADPRYLRTFMQNIPKLEMTTANGDRMTYDAQWRKPVSLLVDGTVRSGKEVLAFGFQEYNIGTVIGQRTGGAVVGGSPIILDNSCILYLAVVDVTVDGKRLEGAGVEPDVRVDDDFRYAQGNDAVIDGAIQYHTSK